MNERKFVVYCHTLKKDGRKYIGITSNDVKKRWNYGNGYRSNRYFYRAIKKYGWSEFEHEILFENLTAKEAGDKEIELIKKYSTTDRNKGFNISYGGDLGLLGLKHSEEAKRKMSLAKKGKKLSPETIEKMRHRLFRKPGYFLGKKLSEEHRRHISEGLKGRICSEETRAKISKANKGKSPRTNYHHSEETKMKIGSSNKGKHHCPMPDDIKQKISKALINHHQTSKKIICIETGEIFLSIHDADRKMNIDSSNISACCRGVYKQTHGYTFKFLG